MSHWGGQIAPANIAEAVTPSDSAGDNWDRPTNGIYVGGAGDVVVVFQGGTSITFTGVAAGTILPVSAVRIASTSTTASSMVAMWSRGGG